MSTMVADREQVLTKLKELRRSNSRPNEGAYDEVETQLKSLHTSLPMTWLDEDTFNAGTSFKGYLYNCGTGNYAVADSDWFFLYANGSLSSAILWTFKNEGGRPNASVSFATTNPQNQYMFLSWRNITGACKLYSQEPQILIKNWDSPPGSSSQTLFCLYDPQSGEYIGAEDSSDNNEMYVIDGVLNQQWQFLLFDTAKFSDDDWLIYRTYLNA
jgi:hypothetical protein